MHAGYRKVREQGAVVKGAGHLTHSSAHSLHVLSLHDDESGTVAPLFRARAHRVVERKLLLGQYDGAVYRLCGEGDVVFPVFGAVPVIGGKLGYEPYLGLFGVCRA